MNKQLRIVPRTASRWQTIDWQNSLKAMSRSVDELLNFCEIKACDLPLQLQAAKDFAVKVTPHYLSLIEKQNPLDPLLLQVLPKADENEKVLGFVSDPLQETIFNKVPGLIHKYHGRVLLIANPSCAIHCRYCFRRHFAYEENTPSSRDWQQALDYIANDPSIHEVILSGGDPLSSNDKQLQNLLEQLDTISHLRTLRIHTRIPVVMPERITDDFLSILQETRLHKVMVLHINHANEVSPALLEVSQLLQACGIRLLNQSVLLKAINDTVPAQKALCFALHQANIQAYYLHLLDKVNGAAHFIVSDDQAIALYKELQAQLPGYMLPKLARETAHDPHKRLIVID